MVDRPASHAAIQQRLLRRFALLAFGQLFGFVGVLLALPVSAALLVGLREVSQLYLVSRFYRGSAAKKLVSRGTGLGLAIVKSIMDLHGGRIKIASAPAAGATVTLIFPASPLENITKM